MCAKGVDVPTGGVMKVGPRQVLYAPEGGDWKYVTVDAKVLRDGVTAEQEDIARLGLQPLLAKPNIIAPSAALANAKASCQLEASSLALEESLETALQMTLPLFLYDDRRPIGNWQPFVDVNFDFGSELTRLDEARVVVDAAKAGLLPLSLAALELQRRRVLGPALDLVDSTDGAEETASVCAGWRDPRFRGCWRRSRSSSGCATSAFWSWRLPRKPPAAGASGSLRGFIKRAG